MKGLNKVTLIGNLGDAPEVKVLAEEVKVAKFSLATNEFYKDQNGLQQAHTEWHTIVAWRGLAVLAEKYLRKGSLVYIEGKLKTRSYLGQDGKKHYVTEIIAQEITLLDKKEHG
ncbi:MAG: single-stranded DNA-binding protein [Cytophagales bacterium]|nr:MAG: single-stranded DNA-binding protein [Cytophagales bacterium]TAF59359.1 MAG: single-stranded DNA-binding protein [Cytophagales bacterium]